MPRPIHPYPFYEHGFIGISSRDIYMGLTGIIMDIHDTSVLQDVVNAICDDDDIRAVSFVGSNQVSTVLIY